MKLFIFILVVLRGFELKTFFINRNRSSDTRSLLYDYVTIFYWTNVIIKIVNELSICLIHMMQCLILIGTELILLLNLVVKISTDSGLELWM